MEYLKPLTPKELSSIENQLIRGYAKQLANNGCLYWLGRRNKHGYGLIDMYWPETGKKRVITVGKAILALRLGYWPDRFDSACHTCDNTSCCLDSHIYHGTPKTNSDDKIQRGRWAKKNKYHTRIRDVSSITVAAIFLDERKYCDIARVYKVSQTYVSDIKTGKIKRLITEPLRLTDEGNI